MIALAAVQKSTQSFIDSAIMLLRSLQQYLIELSSLANLSIIASNETIILKTSRKRQNEPSFLPVVKVTCERALSCTHMSVREVKSSL